MPLRTLMLDQLTIDDESSFAHVGLYEHLKHSLRKAGHRFRVPGAGEQSSWDRVLFLNLTFWSGAESADVLCDEHIPADVVCHVAWHHIVSRAVARAALAGAPSAHGLLLGESVASAFDLYLVGRLVDNAPDSDFITSQVPILAEVAEGAGLPEAAFLALLKDVAREPERAFEDMRQLLFDASVSLLSCRNVDQAQAALQSFGAHRFAPLLHHFQVSNWILYVRAYAASSAAVDQAVGDFDQALRQSPVALTWLAENWIEAG